MLFCLLVLTVLRNTLHRALYLLSQLKDWNAGSAKKEWEGSNKRKGVEKLEKKRQLSPREIWET